MYHKKFEKGQALIIIVVAIIGLIGITGLTVDGGRTFVDRQSAQTSADSAALGAALAKVRSQNVTARALSIAATNGYVNNTTHDTITVTNPITAATTGCDGQPIRSEYRTADYIHVKIVTNVKAYFAPVVGVTQTHNCVEAIARATVGVPGGGGGLFNGAGIVALTPNDLAYDMGGSGKVINHGGGLFSNSTRQPSVVMSGDPRICLDPGYSVGVVAASGGTSFCAWCYTGCPAPALAQLPTVTNNVPQYTQAQIDAMLATVPARPAPPTCPTGVTGVINTTRAGTLADPKTISAGDYPSGINTEGAGIYTMASGIYCFTGSAGFTGDNVNSIQSPTSDVIMVATGSNGVTMQGGTDFTLHSLEIYTQNGTWTETGGSDLYVDKLRFISSGTGNMVIAGDTKIRSLSSGDVPDALLYFTAGKPSWDAGSTLKLHAPSSGGFKGMLVYLPWSNTSPITFDGGTNYSLTGTYMAPHSAFTITAGSNTAVIKSQIVGYKFSISGGAVLNLTYGAADNFGGSAASAPTIELVK